MGCIAGIWLTISNIIEYLRDLLDRLIDCPGTMVSHYRHPPSCTVVLLLVSLNLFSLVFFWSFYTLVFTSCVFHYLPLPRLP